MLDLMKARGLTTLKVGDIELTMAQNGPDPEEEPKRRVYSPEEQAKRARDERRRIILGASGGIIHRASGE